MMIKMWITVLTVVALLDYTYGASAAPPKGPNFDADFLNTHNSLRALHGCGPLAYDATLNAYAQSWADTMAATDNFAHSGGPYGENLYGSWSSVADFTIDGAAAVNSWYSEIKDYDFATGQPSTPGAVTGHFTQVVWKSSTRLGVGVARSASNWIYVVGSYNPPGNYAGQYIENVPPPLFTRFKINE